MEKTMRSFISNFNRGSKGGGLSGILAVFLAAFTAAVILGQVLLKHSPPSEAWQGRVPEPPTNCPTIISEAYSDHSDAYDEAYYGLGDTIQNARKADVILLGNSRVLFAFRDEVVRAFTRSTGIRVFNLSLLAGDGMALALDTMRRQNLYPAIVVVNEDDFFTTYIGPYGRDTVAKGPWRAWTEVEEDRLSWAVRSRLHRWFPRFGMWDTYNPVPYVYYQCRDNGCLVFENFPPIHIPFHPTRNIQPDTPSVEEIRLALEFKQEMERRGTQVIFTNIPFGVDSPEEARRLGTGVFHRFRMPENLKAYHPSMRLAQRLQVPLVVPRMAQITTYDGNHMNQGSADQFAYEFFKEFLKLPYVKALRARK